MSIFDIRAIRYQLDAFIESANAQDFEHDHYSILIKIDDPDVLKIAVAFMIICENNIHKNILNFDGNAKYISIIGKIKEKISILGIFAKYEVSIFPITACHYNEIKTNDKTILFAYHGIHFGTNTPKWMYPTERTIRSHPGLLFNDPVPVWHDIPLIIFANSIKYKNIYTGFEDKQIIPNKIKYLPPWTQITTILKSYIKIKYIKSKSLEGITLIY